MREILSRKMIRLAEDHDSELFRRIELQILLDTTARAFGVQGITILPLRYRDAIRAYARFTLSCIERCEADPDHLYYTAYELGSRIRRITGLTDRKDLEQLVFLLYRNIGISMSGELPGEIIVSGCYFSNFYSPEHCRIMSQVDSGVVAGICGGGRLEFTERITEGCGRCVAVLKNN